SVFSQVRPPFVLLASHLCERAQSPSTTQPSYGSGNATVDRYAEGSGTRGVMSLHVAPSSWVASKRDRQDTAADPRIEQTSLLTTPNGARSRAVMMRLRTQERAWGLDGVDPAGGEARTRRPTRRAARVPGPVPLSWSVSSS